MLGRGLGRALRGVVAVSVLLLAASGAAFAGEAITVIVGGIDKQIYLPVTLAQRLGYFSDAGLDVRLVNVENGIEAQNRLLAGAAQGAVGFYDHTITLQASGFYVTSLVQIGQAPGEVEVVSERYADRIRTPADLKGHRLGVVGLGSSTDALTRSLAHLHGLKFGDYTLVPIESGNRFIEAMTRGEVAAGMTTEPTASRLLQHHGAKILVDLRTPESTRAVFGGCYPGAAFYVRADWLANHPAEAQGLVTALVKAMRFIATHDAARIADQLPEAFFNGDKGFYVDRLAEGKAMFTPDGRMPPGCPEAALKVLASFNKSVRERQIDAARTYSNRLVDAALGTLDAQATSPAR